MVIHIKKNEPLAQKALVDHYRADPDHEPLILIIGEALLEKMERDVKN